MSETIPLISPALDTDVKHFIFSTEINLVVSPEIASKLTPENFMVFLADTVDDYCDGDETIVPSASKFAKACSAEFIDSEAPESEFLRSASRIELEISSFIQYCKPTATFELMTENGLSQLVEIYNPNNLLALTKDIVTGSQDGLTNDNFDLILRYRNIINRLEQKRLELNYYIILGKQTPAKPLGKQTPAKPKEGASTWAGDLHPYGHKNGWTIEGREFRAFSPRDDDGHSVVTVDGESVKL